MGEPLPSYKGCFGCGRDNPTGVALPMEWDGEKVTALFVPKEVYAGFEGIIHGGIVCTLLDEVMWWAIAVQERRCAVTADMRIKFHRPVTTKGRYTVEGWVKEHPRQKVFVASARVLDGQGKVCAQSEARFISLPPEEWERFLEGLNDPSFFLKENG